jgi:hypothetical protein
MAQCSFAVRSCRADSVRMRSGLFRQRACFMQLRHDHFGVGLSDSTSSTGDIIRALGFRAASLVAGLHIAGGGCPSLPCSGSSMDCSTCAGVTVQRSTRPSFNTLVQAAARSSHLDRVVMGMVRHYHRYGRCLPQSLLQVALSLCSRNDSLLPSSRSLLPLITWDAGRHCFAAVCRASFSRSWGVHHIAMVPTLDFVFLSPPPSLLCGVGRGAFLLFLRPRWLVAG